MNFLIPLPTTARLRGNVEKKEGNPAFVTSEVYARVYRLDVLELVIKHMYTCDGFILMFGKNNTIR